MSQAMSGPVIAAPTFRAPLESPFGKAQRETGNHAATVPPTMGKSGPWDAPRRNRSTRRPTKIDVAEVKTVPGRTPLSIVKIDHRTRIAVRASLGPTTCPKSPPGS
jgi:hypothetical protein